LEGEKLYTQKAPLMPYSINCTSSCSNHPLKVEKLIELKVKNWLSKLEQGSVFQSQEVDL
jgi:hypothetical protein